MRTLQGSILAVLSCVALVGVLSCADSATEPLDFETGTLMMDLNTSTGFLLFHEYRDDALDSSGRGNDGTLIGNPHFVPGAIDRALDFDGDGDVVHVPFSLGLQPSLVSVEVCLSPRNDLGAGDRFVPLVVKLDPSDNFSAVADGYDLTFQDSDFRGGGIGLNFGIATSADTRFSLFAPTELPAGAFHHIVGTYDGAQVRLYLDGVLLASLPNTEPIAYRGGPVRVGGGYTNLIQVPSGAYSYFDGIIEEVALYDRALSETEVFQRAVRCGAAEPTPPADPIILLHEYDGSAVDVSGNGNDGALLGDPAFAAGPIDRGIVLDGTDDYIEVPFSSSLQPSLISIETCVSPRTTLGSGDTFVPMVVKMDPRDQFGAVVDGYDLTYQDQSARGGFTGLNFGIGDGNTRTRVQVNVPIDLEAGLYHHVVGTYDGTEMRLYLNGNLVGSQAHTGPIEYRGGPLQVGGNVRNLIQLPSGEAAFFDGTIEETVLYAAALSAEEVANRAERCIKLPSPEEHAIEIDATQLTAPGANIRLVSGDFVGFQTSEVAAFELLPGQYRVMVPASVTGVDFVVLENGTIDFDSSLDSYVGGRGSNRIILNGLTVSIDGSALTAPGRNVLGVVASQDPTLTISVLPSPLPDSGYRFCAPASVACVWFGVGANGLVDFDPDLDSYVSGRGTNTLVVTGLPLNVDARNLDELWGSVQGVTGSLATAEVTSVRLLPSPLPTSGYQYCAPPSVVCYWFGFTPEGTVDFEAELDDIFAGRGTSTLIVGPRDEAGPGMGTVVATPNPVQVGSAVTLTAVVDDGASGGSDIAAAEYSLDGGLTWSPMDAADGFFDGPTEDVSANLPPFTTPTVVDVCVRGTDAYGNTGPVACVLLAAFDPNGGFATGAGWIESPPGAYVPDPVLSGKAFFGFVSKYAKGKTVLDGNASFRFKTADLDFRSSSYDWLVVTQGGTNAQFKGWGTLKDDPTPYRFMIWAGDGEPDTFRIRIWEEVGGTELVLYDNGVQQAIGAGAIRVHP